MTNIVKAPAAKMSQEQIQEQREKCYALEQTIKEGLRDGKRAMWKVAEAAHDFDLESGWTWLGYDHKGEWLADPEISMTHATFYRLTSLWAKLHVTRKIPVADLQDVDISKAQIVLPAITSGKKSTQDALDDAKHLGQRDLRDLYRPAPEPIIDDNPEDEGETSDNSGQEPALVSGEDLDTDEDEAVDGTASGIPVEPDELTSQAAREAWLELKEQLEEAIASGQDMPRIPARIIRTGVSGAAYLLANPPQIDAPVIQGDFEVERDTAAEREVVKAFEGCSRQRLPRALVDAIEAMAETLDL